MKEDRDPKSHVSWCWKQKRGIKLEQPNDNLCTVYIKKAKSSLNMLESATEKDEIDWIFTTAYYARYFAFYALLQKCGIKSEIHDCTIFSKVDSGRKSIVRKYSLFFLNPALFARASNILYCSSVIRTDKNLCFICIEREAAAFLYSIAFSNVSCV